VGAIQIYEWTSLAAEDAEHFVTVTVSDSKARRPQINSCDLNSLLIDINTYWCPRAVPAPYLPRWSSRQLLRRTLANPSRS
jgi:hypothetical protein